MSLFGKFAAIAAGSVILLAACGSMGAGDEKQLSAATPFERPNANWRPFSPNYITLEHVEEDVTAGPNLKTYISHPDSDTYARFFGNFIFDGWDANTGALVSVRSGDYQRPLGIFVASGRLTRLNTLEIVQKSLREVLSVPEGAKGGSATLRILLIPDAEQFKHYIKALPADPAGPITTFTKLKSGCFLSNRMRFAEYGELVVLAMHVPDKAVSWHDTQDRECLTAFFAQSMGVRPDAVAGLLPPANSDPDCVLADIRPTGVSQPKRQPFQYTPLCPEAPIKRAQSLIWYAEQGGAGLAPDVRKIIPERVIKSCQYLVKQDELSDKSCPAVLEGNQ